MKSLISWKPYNSNLYGFFVEFQTFKKPCNYKFLWNFKFWKPCNCWMLKVFLNFKDFKKTIQKFDFLNFDMGAFTKYVTLKRFVTNSCKNIGICTVLCYEGGLKSRKIALRILWTLPNGPSYFPWILENYTTDKKLHGFLIKFKHFKKPYIQKLTWLASESL